MKKGFALLSVVLALVIGSLMGGVLFQAVWQLSKSLTQVSNISSITMRATVFQNILEKELAGAFAPQLIAIEEQDEKSIEAKKKKEQKPVFASKTFYSENEGSQLKLLTFITTCPLDVYNVSKPRVARIMYKIVPDKQRSDFFALQRQESFSITDLEKLDSELKGFIVLGGIKSISAQFFALPEYEKTDKDKKASLAKVEEKEKKEFIKRDAWDVENQQVQENEKKLPLVPNTIKIELVLVDDQLNEHSFDFIFAPMFGIAPICLEGIKGMPVKNTEEKEKEENERLIKNVMHANPLGQSAQKKLESFQFSETKTHTDATSHGPVTGGMQ